MGLAKINLMSKQIFWNVFIFVERESYKVLKDILTWICWFYHYYHYLVTIIIFRLIGVDASITGGGKEKKQRLPSTNNNKKYNFQACLLQSDGRFVLT